MNRRDILRTLAAGGATGAIAAGAIVATVPAGATTDPISPALAATIERHRAALAAQEAVGAVHGARETAILAHPEDDAARVAFDAADEAFAAACHIEHEAHHAVLAEPIATLADMQAKAVYLASVSLHIIHDSGTMAALLASMGGGVAMMAIPSQPDPMRDAVEEYEAAYALQGEMVAAEDWKNCEAIYTDRIGPAADIIRAGPATTSLAGAIAAVRYVAGQTDWLEDDQLAALRSALAYFNART